jgi:hypothetical protein
MANSTLYDDDILLWSEQQAEAIRKLPTSARGLPNELDIENVAEEIESVGRSELAAVESHIELILLHLLKLAAKPDSVSAPHWRSEIVGFSGDLVRRYAPSMRQRIEVNRLWRSALRRAALGFGDEVPPLLSSPPGQSPIAVDDLLDDEIDIKRLVQRILDPRPIGEA